MQRNRQTVRVEIPFNPRLNDTQNKQALRKKFTESLENQNLISYRVQKSFVNDQNILVGTLRVVLEGDSDV